MAGLPRPMPVTLFPQTFTGTSTGTTTVLPEATPGESLACAPPDAPGRACAGMLAQELPIAGLRTPTTSTVLPQALTGAWTGTCTVFPDATPGEFEAEPLAAESACAMP